MAEVDFSNAKIEPMADGAWSLFPSKNPTIRANVSLSQGTLYAISGSTLSTIASGSVTQLVNQQKQLMYLYQGTFTASGTEFYVMNTSSSTEVSGWRIYNISFNSGDTYVFQINATLVCN